MQGHSPGTVLVIGAGPAGLAAAASLKALGVSFDLVDSQNHVGGVWNVANDDAPSWPSKRLTSSRTHTQFEDLRMPVSFPAFPTTDEYATYLRAYTSHHGLTEHFHPNTTVRRLRDFGEGSWEVEFSTGEVRPYAAVIAAHGVSNRPFLPPLFFDARERGVNAIHVKNFAGAEHTSERSVLVIGTGQSAVDVATELADGERRVALHLTEGHWVVPRTIAGLPADALAGSEPGVLGRTINDSVAEKIVSRTVGRPESVGLPAPEVPLLEDDPIVSDELIALVRERAIEVMRDARHLPLESFDLVVFATGYEPGADYLPERYTSHLFLGTFARDRHDFALLGQVRVVGGVIPVLAEQADVAAYAIHAFLQGNTNKMIEFERLKGTSEADVPKTPRAAVRTGTGLRAKVRSVLSHVNTATHRSRSTSTAEDWLQGVNVDLLPEDQALKMPLMDRADVLARLYTVRRLFEK